jgi:deoxyadenosine/deoxycytidine kinase
MKASVPTLVRQIQNRGRLYETSIRLDYISSLNERYEEWLDKYTGKYLVVDMDEKQIERPEDLNEIIEKINAELNGLF